MFPLLDLFLKNETTDVFLVLHIRNSIDMWHMTLVCFCGIRINPKNNKRKRKIHFFRTSNTYIKFLVWTSAKWLQKIIPWIKRGQRTFSDFILPFFWRLLWSSSPSLTSRSSFAASSSSSMSTFSKKNS